uniref:Uncharacterized protein n=1 Tax=Lactuca sativa TaxID=4236 RepID=A0A9R1VYK8_LACSA|nr:hypothetical protein LSAT_V11C400185080 [Lactuca sativa]
MKKTTQQHQPQHHRRNLNRISNYSVLGILQGLIFCRRRNLGSHLLPFFSALVGCFLFLFAFISFLSPPINHHHVHHFHYNHSLLDDEIDFQSHIGNTSTFLVPRAGGSLGDEIWTLSQSELHHGCSQKSETFQGFPVSIILGVD